MQNKPPKYGPWGKVNNSEKNRRSLRERHRHGENHRNYLDVCHCSWMPRHMPGMQYLRFNTTEARWPLCVLCRLQECTQQEGQHRAARSPSLPAPGRLPQLYHLDCAKSLFSITPKSSLVWASVSFRDYWVFLEFQEGQVARSYRPSPAGKFNVLVHPLWPWVDQWLPATGSSSRCGVLCSISVTAPSVCFLHHHGALLGLSGQFLY